MSVWFSGFPTSNKSLAPYMCWLVTLESLNFACVELTERVSWFTPFTAYVVVEADPVKLVPSTVTTQSLTEVSNASVTF